MRDPYVSAFVRIHPDRLLSPLLSIRWTVDRFSHFSDADFVVAAEPLLDAYRMPRTLLMSAVRRDCADKAQPWLTRLNAAALPVAFQNA